MRVSAMANIRKAWCSSVEHMFDGDIELTMMTPVSTRTMASETKDRTCSIGKAATQK